MKKEETLKSYGLKNTAPRSKILQLLEEAKHRHLSAEDIFNQLRERGDDVGLATVYRVLSQFEDVGLLVRHNFDTGLSVYELDSGEHHDHLVCLHCSVVIEFVDDVIEKRQLVVAAQHQFEVQHHSLVMYGVCAKCQSLA